MGKARKAVTAGLTAAGGTLVAALASNVPTSAEGWAAVIGGAVAAGIVAAVATYRVKYDGVHNVDGSVR
jgi:phosphate/sulfate permease